MEILVRAAGRLRIPDGIRRLCEEDWGMTELREKDAMICRACGNEERASEGYPCCSCGTFICVICSFRGVLRCRSCAPGQNVPQPMHTPPQQVPLMDWPEH